MTFRPPPLGSSADNARKLAQRIAFEADTKQKIVSQENRIAALERKLGAAVARIDIQEEMILNHRHAVFGRVKLPHGPSQNAQAT